MCVCVCVYCPAPVMSVRHAPTLISLVHREHVMQKKLHSRIRSVLLVYMALAVAAQSLPACISAGDALEIRGAGGGNSCVVAGGCTACAPLTCSTGGGGVLMTTCSPDGGSDGCALAGTTAVNTRCRPGTGAACTVTPAGCGGVMSPAPCPRIAQPPGGPGGFACDPTVLPFCAANPTSGSPVCALCTY